MLRAGALVLLCLLTFVLGLGRTAIQDADEAFYAEAGREMVERGDWVTPHYNFQPRLQKPILYYWLVAATYRVAGVTEAAARLWAALAGVGLAFVAFGVGRRWIGPGAGWLAGAIVATSFGVVPMARQALPDVPLAFFVSVGIWGLIEAFSLAPPVSGVQASPGRRGAWLHLAAAALALGMLTKGPVAVALALTVLAPLLWWERGRRGGRRWPYPLGWGRVAAAAALFVLIAAPWYVAVTDAQGPDYLRRFFIGENVDRFTTAEYNQWRGWFYGPIVFAGLLPWSFFGLLWLRPLAERLRGRRPWSAVDVRLAAWAFGPLAFYFLSIGSQPRYVIPCLVPLALLLARAIHAHAAGAGRAALLRAAAVVSGGVMVGLGWLIARAGSLFGSVSADWSAATPLLILASGAGVAVAGAAGPRRLVPWIVAGAAAVSIVAFEASVLAPGRPEPVEVVAAAARASGPVPVMCACGAFARNLTFYTHVPTVIAPTEQEVRAFLERPERVMAAIDAPMLARVEAGMGRVFPRLAEVDYLEAGVRQRPATLVAPDPGDLKRVLLISNR